MYTTIEIEITKIHIKIHLEEIRRLYKLMNSHRKWVWQIWAKIHQAVEFIKQWNIKIED